MRITNKKQLQDMVKIRLPNIVRNIKKSCIEGTDIYGLHFMRVILK